MKKFFLTRFNNLFLLYRRKKISVSASAILLYFSLVTIFILPVFPEEDIKNGKSWIL
jgi:cell division protein FtsW (lipid II flippase)